MASPQVDTIEILLRQAGAHRCAYGMPQINTQCMMLTQCHNMPSRISDGVWAIVSAKILKIGKRDVYTIDYTCAVYHKGDDVDRIQFEYYM